MYQELIAIRYPTGYTDWLQLCCDDNIVKLNIYNGSPASFAMVNNLAKQNRTFYTCLLLLLSIYQYHKINHVEGLSKISYCCVQSNKNIPNMILASLYQEHLVLRYSIGYIEWLQLCCDDNILKPMILNGSLISFLIVNNMTKKTDFQYLPLTFVDSLVFGKSKMTENEID